jgi:hypothetical protein
MRVAESFGEARVILDWIEKRSKESFSRAELFDALRGSRFPRVEMLDRPLALLVEYGYLRRLPDRQPGPQGGWPSPHGFAVHPELCHGSDDE